MRMSQDLDEIRVYEGVAERTGLHVDRSSVRRSAGCCRSLTELMRKARNDGDGYFYLPPDLWPAGKQQLEIRKRWIVVSTLSQTGPS